MLPIALGGLALVALLALASKSRGAAKLVARFYPKGSAVVAFTSKKVPWKTVINKETGEPKTLARVQIQESPAQLASQASEAVGKQVSVDAFLLATLMASEAGGGHPLAKAAIAHAALTEAKRHRRPLSVQLAPDGKIGSQQGRYAATSRPPTKADVELAEAILGGKVGNPTPGATNWDSPRGQRAAIARKVPGYDPSNTPEKVARKRAFDKQGRRKMVAMTVPGIDPDYLRLWRPIA